VRQLVLQTVHQPLSQAHGEVGRDQLARVLAEQDELLGLVRLTLVQLHDLRRIEYRVFVSASAY